MSMIRQLWLATLVSLLLSLCGGLLASLLSARGYMESQLALKNQDNAVALALAISESKPDPVMAELFIASLFDAGQYYAIQIFDPRGQLMMQRMMDLQANANSDAKPNADNSTETTDAPAWFMRLLPIAPAAGEAKISNGWQQFGTIRVQSNSRFAYAAMWSSACQMAAALALAAALGGWLSTIILRRIQKPLGMVIGQAQAISERRFAAIEVPELPEFQQLAQAMNAMVKRLKTIFDEEAMRLEQVRQIANMDPVTGVPHRAYFMSLLNGLLAGKDRLNGTLVLVRLAGLVEVNQGAGRQATDAYLKALGAVMQRYVADAYRGAVGRLNGADFALVLPMTTFSQAQGHGLLEQLQAIPLPLASAMTHSAPVALKIQWCIGASHFLAGDTLGQVMAAGDLALAKAESIGGDSVSVSEMNTDSDLPLSAHEWNTYFSHAIENQAARLLVSLANDENAQALYAKVALNLHIKRSEDKPAQWIGDSVFMPVAERLRRADDLDILLLNRAFEGFALNPQWRSVALQMNATSLDQPRFYERVSSVLTAYKHLAPRLILEFSVRSLLAKLSDIQRFCQTIRAFGCKVSVTYVGNRFSDLGQVNNLGLDYWVVHPSYLQDLSTIESNAVFLEGLCNMARGIGVQVIAEDIDVAALQPALKALGFDGFAGAQQPLAAPGSSQLT